VGFYC